MELTYLWFLAYAIIPSSCWILFKFGSAVQVGISKFTVETRYFHLPYRGLSLYLVRGQATPPSRSPNTECTLQLGWILSLSACCETSLKL